MKLHSMSRSTVVARDDDVGCEFFRIGPEQELAVAEFGEPAGRLGDLVAHELDLEIDADDP
uniref:Uncharacterized protein n=1 Tax=Aromatoleum buckelii TaxID=200254 RepID=A0ABX1N5Z9_9RHOO